MVRGRGQAGRLARLGKQLGTQPPPKQASRRGTRGNASHGHWRPSGPHIPNACGVGIWAKETMLRDQRRPAINRKGRLGRLVPTAAPVGRGHQAPARGVWTAPRREAGCWLQARQGYWHRILLANPDNPSRDEAWDRESNQWAPEWVCLRCNATVNSEHPLLQALPPDADRPLCPTHGARCLALDLREGSRGWICSRGAQVLPCRTVRIPLPPANAEPGPANAPPISDLVWFRRGSPPPRTIPGPTHSLPLLHAAVGRLHPDALRAWESDPWRALVANPRQPPAGGLRASPPPLCMPYTSCSSFRPKKVGLCHPPKRNSFST